MKTTRFETEEVPYSNDQEERVVVPAFSVYIDDKIADNAPLVENIKRVIEKSFFINALQFTRSSQVQGRIFLVEKLGLYKSWQSKRVHCGQNTVVVEISENDRKCTEHNNFVYGGRFNVCQCAICKFFYKHGWADYY